jgi:hypothetical protein
MFDKKRRVEIKNFVMDDVADLDRKVRSGGIWFHHQKTH